MDVPFSPGIERLSTSVPAAAAPSAPSLSEEIWFKSAVRIIQDFGGVVSDAQAGRIRDLLVTKRPKWLSSEEAHSRLIQKITDSALRELKIISPVILDNAIQEEELNQLLDPLDPVLRDQIIFKLQNIPEARRAKVWEESQCFLKAVKDLPEAHLLYDFIFQFVNECLEKESLTSKFRGFVLDSLFSKEMISGQKKLEAVQLYFTHMLEGKDVKLREFLQKSPEGKNEFASSLARSFEAIPVKQREIIKSHAPELLSMIGEHSLDSYITRGLSSFVDACISQSKLKDLEIFRKFVKQLPEDEKEDNLKRFVDLEPEGKIRFIAYLGDKPLGKRVRDLIKPPPVNDVPSIDLRKVLAHQFTFLGITQDGLELEGAYVYEMHPYLQKDLEEHYGKDNSVPALLKKSVTHHFESLQELDACIEQDKMIALYGGWEGHAVGAIIFKQGEDYILARCNKGGGCGGWPGIQFHKVGNPEALLPFINRFNGMQKADFTVAQDLELEPVAAYPYIRQKAQKVGNCTFANYHSLERAILYVLGRQEGQEHAEASKVSKEKHTLRARFSALQSLDTYLVRNRKKFDPLVIGSLFMKLPTHRNAGEYELNRLVTLERWLYVGNFSPEQFKVIKEGVRDAWEHGKEVKEIEGGYGLGTDSEERMKDVMRRIERAERMLKDGKRDRAIEHINAAIQRTPGAKLEDLEAILSALDSEKSTSV